jgi:hypothetical protein
LKYARGTANQLSRYSHTYTLDCEAPAIFISNGIQQEDLLHLAALDAIEGVNGLLNVLLWILLDWFGLLGRFLLHLVLLLLALILGLALLSLSRPGHSDINRL